MPNAGPRGEYPGGAIRVATLAALIFLGLLGICRGEAPAKRVLVVHSFGSVAPPFTTHSIAFETELVDKMGERVDLDEVSLDMARYADSQLQEALVEYLQKRHAQWQPDLVVPIGSPAGVFVAQYRDRLFPKVPILYAGMDKRRLPPETLRNNATFVGENFDIPGFVEDILRVAPDTENIAVVIGASPVEQFWAATFRDAFQSYANRINFIWLNDLSLDQMLERVSKLPPRSYVFLILLLRDATGVTHNADEALERLHAVANAPINGIFQHQLGLGIVGGRLYQAETEGIESARVAVRILHGEPASSFPPKVVEALPPRYDWRELQRWNINEAHLPADSTVLFRSPTIWEQYRGWIIAGASICLLQALLISGLIASLAERHRAERSLIESEARFRVVADATPTLIWMSGTGKGCEFFNKAWLDFTGRSFEEERGDGWTKGVHPDDIQECHQAYVTAFDARRPFVMRYRLRNRDGQYRTVTDHGVPRYNADASFAGYIGGCVDVTELLEKEKTLREFEERVTLAAEAAQLGAWELNTTTFEMWMSDSARRLFQFDPVIRITHSMVQDRVHPDDRALRDSSVKKAVETHSSFELEYRALLPDSTVRWFSGRGRCLLDPKGNFTRLVGVTMDVTERKQAQELFRLSIEASPSGILLVNDQGQIILVNTHIEDLFGYKRYELIGKEVEILFSQRVDHDYTGCRAEFLADIEKRPMGHGRELSGLRKDCSEFPVEIGLNPIQTPQGTLVLATVVDISRRKLAEVEARQRREKMSRLNRITLLGEMTASIAHEVNQPLSGIISNASAGQRFIDRGDTAPEKLREILSDIVADGRRAHDVVHNIRNTIKKGVALRKNIDLNEVVRDVAHMLQPDAQAHSCELKTSLADNLPPIEGDPIQIQQVLINLVGNAFDSMGGLPANLRRVEVATELDGNNSIQLTVRDYGPGIPEEVRERLFEQFFTTKKEGLGLGLAIVQSIIESHSGTIRVDNMVDGGARFSCVLPVS